MKFILEVDQVFKMQISKIIQMKFYTYLFMFWIFPVSAYSQSLLPDRLYIGMTVDSFLTVNKFDTIVYDTTSSSLYSAAIYCGDFYNDSIIKSKRSVYFFEKNKMIYMRIIFDSAVAFSAIETKFKNDFPNSKCRDKTNVEKSKHFQSCNLYLHRKKKLRVVLENGGETTLTFYSTGFNRSKIPTYRLLAKLPSCSTN